MPKLLQLDVCLADVWKDLFIHSGTVIMEIHHNITTPCQNHIDDDSAFFIILTCLSAINGDRGQHIA